MKHFPKLGIAALAFLMAAPAFASLVHDDPEVAVAKIETIVQKKKPSKATVKDLTQALKDPNSTVRVKERAAWALGELKVKSAIPALLEASQHKGLLVRSAALNALIHLRAPAALPRLIEIAQADPILSLRQTATLGLGLLQSDKAIDPLVKLSTDPTPEVRGASALAMASLQSTKNDFSEALKEMEADANPYVQERAKKGSEVAHRRNPDVRDHLSSTDVDIRLFAALYFTAHGTSKDLSALKPAWNAEADEETKDQLEKAITSIKKRSAAAKKPAASTHKHK